MARATVVAWFLLSSFLPVAADDRRDPSRLTSPADLWHGYDPEALPLEIEVIKSWQEDGCAIEKVYFTGEIADGHKVRVFAIQGAPVSGGRKPPGAGNTARPGTGGLTPPAHRLPGILHCHGGGQTASLDWVKFWAKRGYVCVSFDICGKWQERKEYTLWGPLEHCNMAKAAGGYQVQPSLRASSWRHWVLVSRRALTLLAKHPQVDAERLGIFGISVGGTTNWMIAGSDKRVKTAVPIYGCGYNIDKRKTIWGHGEPSPDQLYWKQVCSPEAHAPYINCPILWLNASNDFHGWLDDGDDILNAVNGPTRMAITPRFNHHIASEQGRNLELWMDWHLRGGKPWPAGPLVDIRINDHGIPVAKVTAAAATEVREVKVYYSLGNKIPQARFWRLAPAAKHSTDWEAALPVMDAWDDVVIFANVIYESGVCLSTNLKHIIPGQLGKARATLQWSPAIDYGREEWENWYHHQANTDPNVALTFFQKCDGPRGSSGFTLNPAVFGEVMHLNAGCHMIGDPQFQGRDGMAFAFDCKGDFGEAGLSVSIVENDWRPTTKTYTAAVPKKELADEWKAVILPLERFKDKEGKSPSSWKAIEKLELRGAVSKKSPGCFARFRWVKR